MSQWIRWWGLGLFAAILVALWLGMNPLIKWSIESAGTQAVGARVELDGAALRFNPVSLELDRLQVTNPRAPMRNIMEAGRIEMSLNGFALLRRQFIAENMAVEGLRFDTERRQSGAIGGRLFSRERRGDGDGDGSGFSLPGLELPDPEKLVAAERERLGRQLDDIETEMVQIEERWQERIERLPGEEAVAGYRQRWQELEKQDPLRRVSGVRKLKADIDQDLETVRSLDAQLNDDRQRLAGLAERARELPSREADRLMRASGLNDGFQGVTRQLLGEQLNRWVSHGLTGYRLVSEHLAGREEKQEKSGPPRGEGEYIRFPEEEPLPRFLIRRAALDGVVSMAGSSVEFSGSINNITNEPVVLGRPMTLKIDGTGENGAALTVNGTFDHRDTPSRDELELSLRQWGLRDAALFESKRLPVVLERGVAQVDANLKVSEGQLDAAVKTRVEKAGFVAGSEASSDTTQRLAHAIESVSDFRLDLGLAGTLEDPQISLNSDLDRIIGKALGEEARQELARVREELEQKLQTEVASRLDALDTRKEALSQYRTRIDNQREALRKIRP